MGLGPNSEDGGGGDVGRRRVVARVSLTGGVFLSLYFFFFSFFLCVCVGWLLAGLARVGSGPTHRARATTSQRSNGHSQT